MILIFLKWLVLLEIPEADIGFELYVHKNRASEAEIFKDWWLKTLGLSTQTLIQIYFKAGNPVTRRSNVADLYHGLLRIKVKCSTSLNRQVNGWIEGIANQEDWGIV